MARVTGQSALLGTLWAVKLAVGQSEANNLASILFLVWFPVQVNCASI